MADSKHFLTCFICGTFEIENKKFAAFSVTFERFNEWKEIVKGLKFGSKLCEAHFDSEDIIKGKYIFNQFYPLKVFRLSKNAIPKHFLSTKSGVKKPRKLLLEKNVSSTVIACQQSHKNSQSLLSKNVIAYKSKYSKTSLQSSTLCSDVTLCGENQIDEAPIVSCMDLNESFSQVDDEASPEQLLAILEDHNYRKRESVPSELVSGQERGDRLLDNDPPSIKSNYPLELAIGTCLNNEIALLQSSLTDIVPQYTITTAVKKKSCPNEKKIQLPPSLYTCSNCRSKISCKCCKTIIDKYEVLLSKMGKLKRKLKTTQQREKRIKEREKVNMLVIHELKSKIVKLKASQLGAKIADITDQKKVIMKTFIT